MSGNEGGAREVGAKSVEELARSAELVVGNGDTHQKRVQIETEEAADLGGGDGLLVIDLKAERGEFREHEVEAFLACRLRVGDEEEVVEVNDNVEAE